MRSLLLIASTQAQILLTPSDPSYQNLPAVVNRPLNPGPSGSTASACCPGGLPDYEYPSDCSPKPQGCFCHAELLCPLPLTYGTGPGESEGPGPNGQRRNIVHDPDLWYTLKCLNQQDFGPSVLLGCGDAYGDTRIPNKIKGFVNWVDDLGNSIAAQQLSPSFSTHLGMARKYGVSNLEIQRMMAFIAPYVGFDKIFAGWGTWLGQYSNCSVLATDPTNPDRVVQKAAVGVGSPLAIGGLKTDTHVGGYPYLGADVEPFTQTASIAEKVVNVYRQSGAPSVQIDQYTMSWKLPNLAMKAKFFAYLTIEQQYRAETKEVIQQLLQIMYDAGVTTREEVEGYFFFSGCYTGYTRNEALKHKLLDPPAALGSRRASPATDTSSAHTVAVVAIIIAVISVFGNLLGWSVIVRSRQPASPIVHSHSVEMPSASTDVSGPKSHI